MGKLPATPLNRFSSNPLDPLATLWIGMWTSPEFPTPSTFPRPMGITPAASTPFPHPLVHTREALGNVAPAPREYRTWG